MKTHRKIAEGIEAVLDYAIQIMKLTRQIEVLEVDSKLQVDCYGMGTHFGIKFI